MAETGHEFTSELQFPDKFQGLFAKARPRFEPLIVEARAALARRPVPEALRPYYAYGVLDHAQPSFILAPLMYLAMAETQGGITARHRRYLPAFLLMVELIGILDDTVDHTPRRSGRTTYWKRFGAASATPFSCYLLTAALEETRATAPELLPLVMQMFERICASETWEHDARYPEAGVEPLARWLMEHYDAVPLAISHSLDAALILHGLPRVDPVVCERFAELQQDVDDVVNFVERREDEGENDDLKMGIVTHPLLATVCVAPDTSELVERLWSVYAARPDDSPESFAECHARTDDLYATIAERVERIGVPATIRKIATDAEEAIAAASDAVRPCVADMVWTFVERLCRVEELRSDVEQWCPAVRRLQ